MPPLTISKVAVEGIVELDVEVPMLDAETPLISLTHPLPGAPLAVALVLGPQIHTNNVPHAPEV